MEIKKFLEEMEDSGVLLFEEGKEGEKINPQMKKALEAKGIKALWVYQPEGYDLVVMEHDKDGEKPNSWSMAFFTEAEIGGEEGEEIFKEEENLDEAEVGMKIVDQVKGNFLDIVQLAIEVASNKKYKKGFSSTMVKQASAAAKAKK